MEAVPANGYRFVDWSDGPWYTTNPRADSNVTADIDVTANFDVISQVVISGNNKMNVVLFPNPANEMVFIRTNSMPVNNVRLINVLGQVVLTKEANNIQEIAMGHLPKGLYYMVLKGEDKKVMKKLIIK